MSKVIDITARKRERKEQQWRDSIELSLAMIPVAFDALHEIVMQSDAE